jgi:hypothetical protein
MKSNQPSQMFFLLKNSINLQENCVGLAYERCGTETVPSTQRHLIPDKGTFQILRGKMDYLVKGVGKTR